MSGSIKRAWVLVLVVTLVAGCVGTVDNPPAPQILEPAYESMGKATYFPVLLNYAVDNPFEITVIQSERNSQWTYFQISGLKDKAVETRVNGEIKALFEQMLPYAMGEMRPPYRGIDSAVDGGMVFSDGHLYLTAVFNCNNILSVCARASGRYNSLPDQLFFSAVETLNFDLNTGKTFMVEDVFVNDADALELISAFIAEEIRSRSMEEDFVWHRSLDLVSPFKGIGYDQKFYLDNYGLNIVLDYNNPEFDLGFAETVITIPFKPDNGNIAVTERFYDKDVSIYTRETIGKRFFFTAGSGELRTETRIVDGIGWEIVFNYPEEIYSVVKEIADSLWSRDKDIVLHLPGVEQATSVGQNFYASYMGEYINVSRTLHISLEEQYYWQEQYIVCTPGGKVLGLEDIFIEGYDFLSLIEPVLLREAKEQGLTGDAARALMDELTFKLDADRVSFLAVAGNNNPVFFDIPYAVIGSGNLTIFTP